MEFDASCFDCPADAFRREAKRLVSRGVPSVITEFRFDGSRASVHLWYVAGISYPWWRPAGRSVARSGAWVRMLDGRRDIEESWDTSAAVRGAITRSAHRFSQYEKQPASHARLVVFAERKLTAGTPRVANGGIAISLFDDAVDHAKDAAIVEALDGLRAWMRAPVKDACGVCQHLRIELTMALGADDISDERDVQLLACAQCGRKRIALLEESRRGHGERVRHVMNDGRHVSDASVCMLGCFSRADPRCACTAHAKVCAELKARWMTGPLEDISVDRLR